MIVKFLELLVLLTLALLSDRRIYKIKNKIVYPFIILGVITNIYFSGLEGAKQSLLGIVIPIVLLFIIYVLRMLGAGDVKLFSAIGSIMGVRFVIYAMAYSIIAGGLIALIILIINKNGRSRMKYLIEYLKNSIITFKLYPYENFNNKNDGIKFHFSYAIFCGTLFQTYIYFY